MNTDPAPRAPALGLANVGQLFTSPGTAFRQLVERPRGAWWGPMILSAVLITVSVWIMLPQVLEMSYDSAAALMEKVGASQEDMDEALNAMPLESGPKVIATQVLPTLLSVPFFMLLGTLLVHLGARFLGGESRFSQTLGMFSLAYVIWAAGAVVRGAAVAAAGSVEVTLGPGALLPGLEYLSPLGIFLDLFDVFSIWHLFVLVAGISVVTRVGRGTAWGIALVYWVLRSAFFASAKVFMMWTQSV